MSLSIPSGGSGVSFTPALDLPRKQARAVIEQFKASLPGTGRNFTPQELRRAASDIQKVSLTFNHKLQFVVDQLSNEVIVKLIDKETDKVIKVLPPEELQRLHRKLRETIGFLFNEQV